MAGKNESTAVAVREPPKVVAAVESRIGELAKLNASIPSDRFLATFKMAVNKDRKLLKCSEASIIEAVGKACADGLMLDGREAALQVRNVKIGEENGKAVYGEVAVYVPMFQGLMKRARNSGEISAFQGAFIVYEGEVAINQEGQPANPSPITGGPRFVFEQGDNERIFHDPILFGERGSPVGCYSIVRLKDGTVSREFMSWRQIMAIKNRNARHGEKNGRAYTTGVNPVWNSDEEEMAKKTVLRRHCKKLPLSSDLAQIFANMDDAYQDGEAFEGERMEEAEAERKPATKQRGAGAARLRDAQKRENAQRQGANPDTGEIEDAEIVEDGDPGPDGDGGEGPGNEGDGSYF